jgi:hypothetical protein
MQEHVAGARRGRATGQWPLWRPPRTRGGGWHLGVLAGARRARGVGVVLVWGQSRWWDRQSRASTFLLSGSKSSSMWNDRKLPRGRGLSRR